MSQLANGCVMCDIFLLYFIRFIMKKQNHIDIGFLFSPPRTHRVKKQKKEASKWEGYTGKCTPIDPSHIEMIMIIEMKGAPVWFVNATMAPSGKGQQKPKYSSPKPKPKPKNKVAQQLLQRSRETASSHSFYLSIPPLCLFFQPLIYVSIYLQYYYPSFSLYTDTNNK